MFYTEQIDMRGMGMVIMLLIKERDGRLKRLIILLHP